MALIPVLMGSASFCNRGWHLMPERLNLARRLQHCAYGLWNELFEMLQRETNLHSQELLRCMSGHRLT